MCVVRRYGDGFSPPDSLAAALKVSVPPHALAAGSSRTETCAVCGERALTATLLHDRDRQGERIKRHKSCKP
jgi:hypothetical protein